MNVLIVMAHPERASFNGGLADVAQEHLRAAGYVVELDDLYRKGFDPVEHANHYAERLNDDFFAPLTEQRAHYERGSLPPEVRREIARLEWADLVIFQFPLWWHAQPAILKGWFDRVLVYGGLYSGSRRYDRGHFRGKRAICSVTTGSPEQAFMPFGRAGNMVEWLWPMHSSLYYVGFDVLASQVSYGRAAVSSMRRKTPSERSSSRRKPHGPSGSPGYSVSPRFRLPAGTTGMRPECSGRLIR